MYEGIEDILKLLDAGRLKEALTQLQAINMQAPSWELQNRIESMLTAYGYLLQYASQGMEDPTREDFYRQTLCTTYEMTDAVNIALMSQKKSGLYFDRIRTFKLHPAKTYAQLQLILETYTEDIGTAPLLYHEPERLQTACEQLYQQHEQTATELFDKTWTTPLWTENEAKEASALMASILVPANDKALLVSAVTLALLRVFDAKKLHFLLDAYQHENVQVNQRAMVGTIITIAKHTKRINLYPDLCSRLSLLREEEKFQENLFTIQMQLLITRETTKIDKKMREEIIPEMMKNAKQLNDPKFRFDDVEDQEDRNPEWEEWIDKSEINEKIKQMGEWQMAGADVYMSSFAQLKHYPFFHTLSHWFYPFDLEQPTLAPLKKELERNGYSVLKLIAYSDYFCNSDKYSFALAMLGMPQAMKEASIRQMEEQTQMHEELKDKFKELSQHQPEAKSISRQYIQDLYRFFKLWKHHQEEEDIFKWKFNLWENPLLGNAIQQENTIKELANYLLQNEYLDETYTLYQRLMGAYSPVAEVYQKAGYIQQKKKKYTEAIQHYKQADILQPDNHWTNKHLAQCYRLSNDMVTALEYYRKVEVIQPDNLNVALQIGQCLARMGQYKEALSYFYKVEYLEKNPNNARRAIAWCSFVSGKYEEALKYYEMLLQEPTPKAQDWMNMGHVHFAMHQMQEAIRYYQQAQSFEKSHTAFIEQFNKDRKELIAQGLSMEDLNILLDLLV